MQTLSSFAPSDPSEFVLRDWKETGVKIVGLFGVPLFAATNQEKTLGQWLEEAISEKIQREQKEK
jgi:hypothetical protein